MIPFLLGLAIGFALGFRAMHKRHARMMREITQRLEQILADTLILLDNKEN
jgi:hypothetical protein